MMTKTLLLGTLLGTALLGATARADETAAPAAAPAVAPAAVAAVVAPAPAESFLPGDTNDDGIIDATEAQKAAELRLDKMKQNLAKLFIRADANKDGEINAEEAGKLEEQLKQNRAKILEFIQPLDLNKDWKIDDQESVAALEKIKGNIQKQNEMILKRFDENKDGKLSGAELENAQKGAAQFRNRAKERRQERQGGMKKEKAQD